MLSSSPREAHGCFGGNVRDCIMRGGLLSPEASRVTAHDSGPMSIAIPSSQGTYTLYSSPVSRRFAYVVRLSPDSDRRADIPDRQLRARTGREQMQQLHRYSITSS